MKGTLPGSIASIYADRFRYSKGFQVMNTRKPNSELKYNPFAKGLITSIVIGDQELSC
jgi:hypothetical protein